jgi:hypothetical protein
MGRSLIFSDLACSLLFNGVAPGTAITLHVAPVVATFLVLIAAVIAAIPARTTAASAPAP